MCVCVCVRARARVGVVHAQVDASPRPVVCDVALESGATREGGKPVVVKGLGLVSVP